MGCFPLKEIKACISEREFITVSRIFKMSHPLSHPKGECSGTTTKKKKPTIVEKAEELQGKEMLPASCRAEHSSTSPSPAPPWPGAWAASPGLGSSGPGRKTTHGGPTPTHRREHGLLSG